jgi:apolipoprotein D and lipocalin family protein
MNKLASLIFLVCVTTTFAQFPGRGPCPDVQIKEDLEVEPYLGTWFSHHQYPATFSIGATCITAEYGLNPNGSVSVVNSQIGRNGEPNSVEGHAVVVGPGRLQVFFPGAPTTFEEQEPRGNYWVLDTDYENYSVVYSCANFGNLRVGKKIHSGTEFESFLI